MSRNSQAEAARTRSAVADRAADLGSVEGLETLSIGRLADDLGLSKSGVIGPFGSKEELQMAAVNAGIDRFGVEVWDPVADLPAGERRLRALIDSWFSYLEREVFPGGCFLTAASLEFDDRPGPVRDLIAKTFERWLSVLEHEVTTARRQGELDDGDSTAAQIAFSINAYVMAGNWAKQLFGDPAHLEASRVAAHRLLVPRTRDV